MTFRLPSHGCCPPGLNRRGLGVGRAHPAPGSPGPGAPPAAPTTQQEPEAGEVALGLARTGDFGSGWPLSSVPTLLLQKQHHPPHPSPSPPHPILSKSGCRGRPFKGSSQAWVWAFRASTPPTGHPPLAVDAREPATSQSPTRQLPAQRGTVHSLPNQGRSPMTQPLATRQTSPPASGQAQSG